MYNDVIILLVHSIIRLCLMESLVILNQSLILHQVLVVILINNSTGIMLVLVIKLVNR